MNNLNFLKPGNSINTKLITPNDYKEEDSKHSQTDPKHSQTDPPKKKELTEEEVIKAAQEKALAPLIKKASLAYIMPNNPLFAPAMSTRNKYLKYKAKYLKLKKEMSI